MANLYWPTSVVPPEKATENNEFPTVRSSSESGSVVSRPRYTRARGKWKLSWSLIDKNQYAIVKNFYLHTTLAGSLPFNWTHPMEGKIYVVRFAGELEGDPFSDQWYSMNCTFEEV